MAERSEQVINIPLPHTTRSSAEIAWARLRTIFTPVTIVSLLLAALLIFLVANPLMQIVTESFANARTRAFTFANYAAAFARPRYILAFYNSLELGAWVAAVSGAIGVPLAWAVSRTNMPFRNLVHAMVIVSFLVPPFIGAIGWILLGGPNAGWINRTYMAITGASAGPVNIFTFSGLVVVISLYVFPLIYVFTKSALDLVSTEMEEAAAILGAGPFATTMRVTLPLVLPAILGSLFIVFLEVLGLYGTAALIAIPAGVNVVTTQLAAFFENPVRVEVAAAFAMPLIGITVLLLGLQKLVLGRKGYVTVGGKGGHRTLMDLGLFRYVMFGYAALIGLLSVVLPLYIILQSAFSRSWVRGLTAGNITLDNFYQALIGQPSIVNSLINTFHYAFWAATACTALGFSIAYIVHRKLLPYAGILGGITVAPFAIPGIVLAICFYAAYAPPPFSLYGLGVLIIIAFITRFLPIAFVNSRAAIQGLHPELEEAVRIAGGSQARAVWQVVLPILKMSLLGSWLLIFVIGTRELSTAMFLSGPQTRVISVLTIEMSEQGQYEILSAIAVLLLLVTGIIVALGTKIMGRDFMLRRS